MATHARKDEDLVAAHCVFIPWIPPTKSTLSKLQLNHEQMRVDGMPLKGSYSWSSVRSRVGAVLLRRHAYAGMLKP